MRQPLASTGWEGATGRLGSQETSLRSLHQALEERGSRMQAVSFRRLSALCAAVLSLAALAVLPAGAAASSSQEEIDTAVGMAVEYVRGQQDPLTGEPFGFEHGSFSSDWVATSLVL